MRLSRCWAQRSAGSSSVWRCVKFFFQQIVRIFQYIFFVSMRLSQVNSATQIPGIGQWQHASPGHVGDINILTSQGEVFNDIVYRSQTTSGAGRFVMILWSASSQTLPPFLPSFYPLHLLVLLAVISTRRQSQNQHTITVPCLSCHCFCSRYHHWPFIHTPFITNHHRQLTTTTTYQQPPITSHNVQSNDVDARLLTDNNIGRHGQQHVQSVAHHDIIEPSLDKVGENVARLCRQALGWRHIAR